MKSDEIILLASLYNKVFEKVKENNGDSLSDVLKEFKKRVLALSETGKISKESARDILYCLDPQTREKIIDEIKKDAIDEVKQNKPFFSSNIDKELIDEILEDEIKTETRRPSRSSERSSFTQFDPCSHSGTRIGGC